MGLLSGVKEKEKEIEKQTEKKRERARETKSMIFATRNGKSTYKPCQKLMNQCGPSKMFSPEVRRHVSKLMRLNHLTITRLRNCVILGLFLYILQDAELHGTPVSQRLCDLVPRIRRKNTTYNIIHITYYNVISL
jgi:hypothetical protein